MADSNHNRLYIIVGAIVVGLAILFYFMSGTRTGTATTDPAAEGDTAVVAEPEVGAANVPPVEVETDTPPAVDSPAEPLAPAPSN
jgi:hypothetical protein